MTPQAIIQALGRHGVVPVIREDRSDLARRAIQVLGEATFGTFEITLTTPGAIDIIAELAQSDVFVGAGTVLTADDAERCLDAGARYIVTPCFVESVAEICDRARAACILGALTPLEVQRARDAGAHAVKIFPASSVDGPRHLRALRSVFPHTAFVPTGGVSLDNLTSYLSAGAHFVGVGSELIDRAALERGDSAGIIAHATRFLDKLVQFRSHDDTTPLERKP